jgi:hypothetical protein
MSPVSIAMIALLDVPCDGGCFHWDSPALTLECRSRMFKSTV